MLVVAIDIGGTFTDLIGFDEKTQTLHSGQEPDHAGPARAGHHRLPATRAASRASAIDELIHGSTIAINTLIERKGAKTGLLVTRGTRDVYIIGRGNRPEAYNLLFHKHRPLVSRQLTREVDERMLASGEVHVRLDRASVEEACRSARGGRRRGGRGLLPALLRQPRARARRRRDDARGAAGRLSLALARHPARVPRVRAHVDDGGERLYRPEGRRLRRRASSRASARSAFAAISRSCARTAA